MSRPWTPSSPQYKVRNVSPPRVKVLERVAFLQGHKGSHGAHIKLIPDNVDVPCSQQESRVKKFPAADKHQHCKRHSWCVTTSFLPDTHAVFQRSVPPRSRPLPRPVSAIGILHSSTIDSRFFGQAGQRLSAFLFRPSSVVHSNSSAELLRPSSETLERIDTPLVRSAMTPSKERQPLPCSHSITANHGTPNSYQEWQFALKEVQVLFLKRLWKQCKLRCERLLDECLDLMHPLHECYLQFYAALSDEMLALALHNLNTAKLPSLRCSKDSYAAALKSLRVLNRSDVEQCRLDDEISFNSRATSVLYTPTPAAGIPPTAPPLAPWASSSPSRLIQSQSWTTDVFVDSPTHRPSPLRIRKLIFDPYMQSTELDAPCSPPSSPPQRRSIQVHTPATVAVSDCTTTWLEDRTLQRYNGYIQDFDEMLLKHIEAIDAFIKSVEEAQANFRAGKRSVSDNIDSIEIPDKKARVKELVANGWKRENFRPKRYQELCDKALAEL